MDPQTMLISAAVTVVSAVVIYLIYACGMQERTYEEVMAEQRRLHQSEFLTGKKTDKKEKVKKKKKPKSEKVAAEEVITAEEPVVPEVAEVEVHREATPPPPELEESLEEGELPPTPPPPKSSGKKRKDKRREETPPVVETIVKREVVQEVKAVRQHVEKVKETKITSSKANQLEMEMNLEAQILQDAKPMKAEREGKKSKKNKANMEASHGADKVDDDDDWLMMMTAPVAAKQEPDNKTVKPKPEDSMKSVANLALMQTIRTSPLNDNEIQAMIDILLNKQGAASPTIEWTKDKKSQKGDPMSMLKRQLEEKEQALIDEQHVSQAAQGKLKDLKAELSGERQRYVSLDKTSQDKVGTQQAEIMALHARMQSSHTQHNQEIHTLRQQVDGMKGALGSGAANNKQMQQLADENRKLKETSMKAGDMANIQQQNTFLQEQLNNAMTKVATTENTKKSLEKRMEDQIRKLDNQKKEQDTKVKTLSQENSMLVSELQTTRERTAAEGEEAPSNTPMLEKENTMNTMQSELEAKLDEIKQLSQDLDAQKKKNNEVLQLKEELTIVKKENHELREGCEVATKKLTEAEESAEEIAEMQAQLKAKVTEVERLRDALNNKEAELEQVSSIPGSPAHSASPNPELLKRLFPEAKTKTDMTEEEWAATFEQEAKKYMEKSKLAKSKSEEDISSKLQASQAAQAKLQAQVQHYKTVLADTEGILNKLQSSVESEEKKWQQRTVDEVNKVKEEYSKNDNTYADRIMSLEDKLLTLEDEREGLQSKLSESTQSLNSLQDQIDSQSLAEEETIKSLEEELEGEKKSKKDLSSANVRLNSLVKIGTDALKAEQEAGRKLQKQLRESAAKSPHSPGAGGKQSMANGSNGSSPSPAQTQTIKELKEKLAKAQRQLEREAANNRTLAKRLASATAASSNGSAV